MRHVRVAVHNGAFCIAIDCPACLMRHAGSKHDFVDCAQGACDNHKVGETTLPETSDKPPFELPSSAD